MNAELTPRRILLFCLQQNEPILFLSLRDPRAHSTSEEVLQT